MDIAITNKQKMKEIKDLFNMLGEHIDNSFLMGTFTLIAYLLYLVRDALKKAITNITIIPYIVKHFSAKAELDSLYNIKDLNDHGVFDQLTVLKSKTYEFYTNGKLDKFKTLAFETFLKAKMDTTAEYLRLIIESTDKKMKPGRLQTIVNQHFENCANELEKNMRTHFKEAGVDAQEIDFVMEKFTEVRLSAKQHYINTFDNVFKDRSLVSNYVLLTVIFHIVGNEGLKMVQDCKKVFDAANGSFLTVKYGVEKKG